MVGEASHVYIRASSACLGRVLVNDADQFVGHLPSCLDLACLLARRFEAGPGGPYPCALALRRGLMSVPRGESCVGFGSMCPRFNPQQRVPEAPLVPALVCLMVPHPKSNLWCVTATAAVEGAFCPRVPAVLGLVSP